MMAQHYAGISLRHDTIDNPIFMNIVTLIYSILMSEVKDMENQFLWALEELQTKKHFEISF